MTPVNFFMVFCGVVFSLVFILSVITSLIEKQVRAAIISMVGLIVISGIYFSVLFIQEPLMTYYSATISVATIVIGITLLYNPRNTKYKIGQPAFIFDERDTMFSRRELVPGTEKYNRFYDSRPELKSKDGIFRKQPGLLSNRSAFYSPLAFSAADASFYTIEKLGPYIIGDVATEKIQISTKKLTEFIKNWSLKQGAFDVNVCLMKDYHYYHTKGRRETYDKKVTPKYKYGIALTVEMDEEMMKASPKASAIMESAEQYLKSGTIAVQLASFIRNTGYPAQAHIDGNYEVICPLVARDAGLGEIGRMGLLMTPYQGPRVRIAVVTTDAPLETYTGKIGDESMIEFCTKCKKCAVNCPSQSIPFDDRKVSNDALRWKIDSESCYTYWTKVGTDCGRCMQVCPYAHPNNLMHNMVRFGIKHSKIFRIAALHLDDLFYRRKPPIGKLPKWVSIN